MTKIQSRLLVIDADVAGRTGRIEKPVQPASKLCRDFLFCVEDLYYKIVMTKEIIREWKRHETNFARQWLVGMKGKKLFVVISPAQLDKIREKVRKEKGLTDKDKEIILKDIHLVEAAIATDKIVISLDDTARKRLRKFIAISGEIGIVNWINPTNPNENPIEWLENGAKWEKRHSLEFLSEQD